MARVAYAIIAAAFAAMPLPAAGGMVARVGTASCGTWTARRSQNIAVGEEQWVLGYLSGLQAATNVTGGLRLDPLAGASDAQGVWAWIDNFCRSNPLETIEWAAFSFSGFVAGYSK